MVEEFGIGEKLWAAIPRMVVGPLEFEVVLLRVDKITNETSCPYSTRLDTQQAVRIPVSMLFHTEVEALRYALSEERKEMR